MHIEKIQDVDIFLSRTAVPSFRKIEKDTSVIFATDIMSLKISLNGSVNIEFCVKSYCTLLCSLKFYLWNTGNWEHRSLNYR